MKYPLNAAEGLRTGQIFGADEDKLQRLGGIDLKITRSTPLDLLSVI